jgi:hypothetical protein
LVRGRGGAKTVIAAARSKIIVEELAKKLLAIYVMAIGKEREEVARQPLAVFGSWLSDS